MKCMCIYLIVMFNFSCLSVLDIVQVICDDGKQNKSHARWCFEVFMSLLRFFREMMVTHELLIFLSTFHVLIILMCGCALKKM